VTGAVETGPRERLGALEGAAFERRAALVRSDLVEALTAVYGTRCDISALADALVADALEAAVNRPDHLRLLDRVREVDPGWFLRPEVVGYVCYTDRFAGTLVGLEDHLDYLTELGVGYLHLMPLLQPREGENDGGYAVQDYDATDPRLGDMADLEHLASCLHDRQIALCVDLVLNHTAREHAWARAALAGDERYRDFYLFFRDRTEPDAYERALPDVFPDMAPGSFTRLEETGEWVWTTFHEFQWDLNWANPEVFRAMLAVLLTLGNHGVDVVRLDAAPFLWKRVGTSCQNQPEAHRILQALRALTRLAMPGVVLKAEAIVGPDELLPYLGAHERQRPECDLAYDNQLMVMLWSAVASRDVRLMEQALGRRPTLPVGTGWVSYVRCHDDIGWAVGDADAWAVAIDPTAHRRFLTSYFAGRFKGSFARGLDFGVNPVTGDARTSGMTASLTGLQEALSRGDAQEVDAALRRVESLHSVIYSFGGIPLVYMGDELAMLNDDAWATVPEHEDDNRWLHRPRMDWVAAGRRHDHGSVEGRTFAALQRLGKVRRSTEALGSAASTTVLPTGNPRVFGYVRRHPRAAPVVALVCFSDREESVDADVLQAAGLRRAAHLHSSDGQLRLVGGRVVLPAWSFLWVTAPE
jgi:amylosucrase